MSPVNVDAKIKPRDEVAAEASQPAPVAIAVEADPVDGLLSALGVGGLSSFVSRPGEN